MTKLWEEIWTIETQKKLERKDELKINTKENNHWVKYTSDTDIWMRKTNKNKIKEILNKD